MGSWETWKLFPAISGKVPAVVFGGQISQCSSALGRWVHSEEERKDMFCLPFRLGKDGGLRLHIGQGIPNTDYFRTVGFVPRNSEAQPQASACVHQSAVTMIFHSNGTSV